MATIRPFRALRPAAEVASRVAAVPYDVVSTDEARALADGNPLSFLHVSRAEIDLAPGADPYADEVYTTAADRFGRLRASLLHEAVPTLYLYRLRMGAHTQTGLAATYSIAEYESDVIKKHERTRPDKEDDRTRHIIALRAQTGPVFLTYRRSARVDELARSACEGAPLYDFVADDGVAHTVWRVEGGLIADLVQAFATIPILYIADGHHRAASAARAHRHFDADAGDAAEHAWFLAVAFPDDQVQILPYHRVVRDLGGLDATALLAAIRDRVTVEESGPEPGRRGRCTMYLAGRWYALRLDTGDAATDDPIQALDVSRLQETVIQPVLGIADVRTDKRIDFVGGIRGTSALERLVDAGDAAVAFALYPVTVADLMAVADAGGIMPPKSTWFEPKLRDGLLTHLI